MPDTHAMNRECIEQFAIINTNLAHHQAWRTDTTEKLDKIRKEIEKLTGNGNRGKIEEIKLLLQKLSDNSEARQFRIEELERKVHRLESKAFSIALQVAGAVGAISLIIHFILGKLIH